MTSISVIESMIENGEICSRCGEFIYDVEDDVLEDEISPGYKRICQDCKDCED